MALHNTVHSVLWYRWPSFGPIFRLTAVFGPILVKSNKETSRFHNRFGVYVITNWDLWPARFIRHSKEISIHHFNGNYRRRYATDIRRVGFDALHQLRRNQTMCDLLFDLLFGHRPSKKCNTIYERHQVVCRFFMKYPKTNQLPVECFPFNIQHSFSGDTLL